MKKAHIITGSAVLVISGLLFYCLGGTLHDNTPDKTATTPRETKTDTVTVTDRTGKKITITLPVKKIAFNHFSTGEALKIIDAWDMVAGRSKNLDKEVFPDLDKIPVISGQGLYDLNYEKLFELEVDLFITINISRDGYDEICSKLEPDIPVVAMHLREPGPFEQNLETLGMLLGKQKETAEYLAWYADVKEKLVKKIRPLEEKDKPMIFYKTSWGSPEDIQTLTDRSPGIPERNALTGSINAAGDIPSAAGWVQSVNTEWLTAMEYDILIIGDIVRNGYGVGVKSTSVAKEHRDQVMSLPAFSGSNAVKNNRVYMITGELFGTPRFIIGFSYMAKWFHPEIFKELDPKALHQEYLNRFLKIDCDLDKQGVFVYPDKK